MGLNNFGVLLPFLFRKNFEGIHFNKKLIILIRGKLNSQCNFSIQLDFFIQIIRFPFEVFSFNSKGFCLSLPFPKQLFSSLKIAQFLINLFGFLFNLPRKLHRWNPVRNKKKPFWGSKNSQESFGLFWDCKVSLDLNSFGFFFVVLKTVLVRRNSSIIHSSRCIRFVIWN